jgi:hypothetical protein
MQDAPSRARHTFFQQRPGLSALLVWSKSKFYLRPTRAALANEFAPAVGDALSFSFHPHENPTS